MKRILVLVGIVAVLAVVGLLALPVKDRCGSVNYACATAPDAEGYVHYYYEVKPLVGILIESVTDSKFPFHHSSGEEKEKVGA
jgi:hypothetical protein